jgi:DNA-binding response OmpR family regulator
LLVEDDPHDAQRVQDLLATLGPVNYDVTHAETLAAALVVLRKGMTDVTLLDLALPDSDRGDTVPAFMDACPSQTAVVVVSGVDDEELAAVAIQYGAQDYVVKGRFDAFLLGRVMRYAVERQRLQRELGEAAAATRAQGSHGSAGADVCQLPTRAGPG